MFLLCGKNILMASESEINALLIAGKKLRGNVKKFQWSMKGVSIFWRRITHPT